MRGRFEKKIIMWSVLTAFIPLLMSYGIFVYDKFTSTEEDIKDNLYKMSVNISKTPFVIEKLNSRELDEKIQRYADFFIDQLKDIDIIVLTDMNGIKYSHIDKSQIGKVFVNEDL